MEKDDECLETATVPEDSCVLHSDDIETDGRPEVRWWGDPSRADETVAIDTGYGESDTAAESGGDADGPNVNVGTDHIVIG